MKRMTTLMAAIALSAFSLQAQTFGEIHGKVLNEKNQPEPYVAVSAQQGENRFSAQTDDEGRFVLKPLPVGNYTLRVVLVNYTHEEPGILVSSDNVTRVKDIVMKTVTELQTAVVSRKPWTQPLLDEDNTGMTKLFHKQFKHNPQRKDPVSLIATAGPGVYKGPNGDGLFFRGSRSENMCYYVDGVKMPARMSGVPSDAINSISVYTGGLPAKYGDVTGGVVAIETKSYFDLYEQRNAGIR